MADSAEACIVCLGDLKTALDCDNRPSSPASDALPPASATRCRTHSIAGVDDERIAHLLPCKHNLHNECLKPWVERANSCPICRAQFNQVDLKDYLDGPTIGSYPVQDKKQQAELDPMLVIDDIDFEQPDEPCILCGSINANDVMYCDGCDRTVHILCAGSGDDIPDVWYCQDCLRVLERGGNLPNAGGPQHRQNRMSRELRQPPQPRRRPARRPNSDWARVWQSVWDNLNLDLDFPFDEEPAEQRRTPAQRRDFAAWQRRLRVASHQGAADRFRQTATALLDRGPPESQEELRAWNAFDKAREVNESTPTNGRRKRNTSTEPSASPRENAEPERRLKRPRTRRNIPVPGSSAQAESSNRASSRVEAPSFLTSLLQEVERQPQSSHASPDGSSGAEDLGPVSSPDGSPVMTGVHVPRAASMTPPPLMLPRSSLTPLTSIVRPLPSPPIGAFSPFSPTSDDNNERRSRRQTVHETPTSRREQSPRSPSRNLSFSTKSEIQRMVKNALGSRYRNKEITKDQYTDINRDVSRLLYEQIENANDLADQDSRDRLQKLAADEVQRAVEALST